MGKHLQVFIALNADGLFPMLSAAGTKKIQSAWGKTTAPNPKGVAIVYNKKVLLLI